MDPFSCFQLLDLLDCKKEAVFVKNLNGQYTYINSHGAALLGSTVEAVVGHGDDLFFSPQSVKIMREREDSIVADQCPRSYLSTVMLKDGETAIYESTKSVLRNREGVITSILGSSRDVTHLRLQTADYQSEIAWLNSVRRELVERLNRVSTDFRVPLNDLSLRLQMIEKILSEVELAAGLSLASAKRVKELALSARTDGKELRQRMDDHDGHYQAMTSGVLQRQFLLNPGKIPSMHP